jgi:hypothetical protein
MSDFKREITVAPAYDLRDKGCGIHGCEMQFVLSKDGRGVTFEVYTNWMLPHVQEETNARAFRPSMYLPMGAGVSYHDQRAHYEGQHCRDDCTVTGGVCYSDGSYTMGDDLMRLLIEKGSDGVWAKLEELYDDWLVKDRP